MTTTEELLEQCACSDQMSAAQIYAHQQAGELPIQFAGKEPRRWLWPTTVFVAIAFAVSAFAYLIATNG